jgi:hypothetical protein
MPLKEGRRIALTVTVDAATHEALRAYGNRSYAVEELVKRFLHQLPRAEARRTVRP